MDSTAWADMAQKLNENYSLYEIELSIADENGKVLTDGERMFLQTKKDENICTYNFSGISSDVMKIIDSGKAKVVPKSVYLKYGKPYKSGVRFDSFDYLNALPEIKVDIKTAVFSKNEDVDVVSQKKNYDAKNEAEKRRRPVAIKLAQDELSNQNIIDYNGNYFSAIHFYDYYGKFHSYVSDNHDEEFEIAYILGFLNELSGREYTQVKIDGKDYFITPASEDEINEINSFPKKLFESEGKIEKLFHGEGMFFNDDWVYCKELPFGYTKTGYGRDSIVIYRAKDKNCPISLEDLQEQLNALAGADYKWDCFSEERFIGYTVRTYYIGRYPTPSESKDLVESLAATNKREAEEFASFLRNKSKNMTAEEQEIARNMYISFKAEEWHLGTNLSDVTLEEKKGTVTVKDIKKGSIFIEKGLQKKDVITEITVTDESGVSKTVHAVELKGVKASATCTFTVQRGSGKKAQTLTITVPVEWDKERLEKLEKYHDF